MYARVIRGTKDCFIYLFIYFLIQKNQLSFVLANGKTTRGKMIEKLNMGKIMMMTSLITNT